MPMSIESFRALLKFSAEIADNYSRLKNRLGDLKHAIGKAKIRSKDAEKEIDLCLGLLDVSIKETDEGIKEFTKWLHQFIDGIPRLPKDVLEHLEDFRKEKLKVPINYGEVIKELINIAEIQLKRMSEEERVEEKKE